MNILVTGIDGFVGSHLAEALLDRVGVHTWGLIRTKDASRNIRHIQSRLNLRQCELTDFDEVRSVIEEIHPEGIVHLAGQAFVPTSLRSPYDTFQSNVLGTLNVLESLRQLGSSCPTIVVSSGEVYGAVEPSRLPIDESLPYGPQNPYAASKASADLIAQQYRSAFGVNVVVARPFNHLGPRQSELFVGSAFAKQIAEIKSGQRPPRISVGNLDAVRDFTDVRDVVRAYLAILEAPENAPVYNICSGVGVAIHNLLYILRELSQLDVAIEQDPERLRPSDIPVIVGSYQCLKRKTTWEPRISLRETLRDLLAYWEETLAHPRD